MMINSDFWACVGKPLIKYCGPILEFNLMKVAKTLFSATSKIHVRAGSLHAL